MTFARWFAFTGSLVGGLYTIWLLAVLWHELAHGAAAVACGGRFLAFDVSPGLGGWAQSWFVPEPRQWIVTWAGIATNVVMGALALAWSVRKGPHLARGALVMYLVAVSGLGFGLGYTLQGLLFEKGDAGGWAAHATESERALAIAGVGTLFVAFVVWALRRLLGYLAQHYEAGRFRDRAVALLASVAGPLALLEVLKPTVDVFDASERVRFKGGLFAGAIALALLLAVPASRGADPARTRRPGVLEGAVWLAVAAGAYAATELWLRDVRLTS